MATFNTVEELIQILDENPHWLEALRARLLTRELLELPQRHAEFVALSNQRYEESVALADKRHKQFTDFVELSEQRHKQFTDFVELSEQRHEQFTDFVELSEQRHEQFTDFVELSEQRHKEIRDDIGMLKGYVTEAAVIRFADDVAIELGLRRVNTLSANRLMDMAESADTTRMFDSPQSRRDNLRSFRRADLILEARDPKNPDGEICYIAVESSYTINGRDTRRALRNAEYLERFTQKKAYAVVAGVHLDDRIREDVESGRVFWYEIEERMIRRD